MGRYDHWMHFAGIFVAFHASSLRVVFCITFGLPSHSSLTQVSHHTRGWTAITICGFLAILPAVLTRLWKCQVPVYFVGKCELASIRVRGRRRCWQQKRVETPEGKSFDGRLKVNDESGEANIHLCSRKEAACLTCSMPEARLIHWFCINKTAHGQ